MDDEESQLFANSTDMNTKWFGKVQVLVISVNLVFRLAASFAVAAYEGWLPRQKRLLQRIRTIVDVPFVVVLPIKFPSFSLTTTVHPSVKFDHIYQVISTTLISCLSNQKWFPKKSNAQAPSEGELEPEPSVHVDVLYDPTSIPIQADVIFIHGLHGSLFNTWKQGLWGHRKHVQNLPLKHKYKVETGEKDNDGSDSCAQETNRKRYVSFSINDPEYDQLLESITDLINNIDDTLKKSKRGGDQEDPYSPCWPRDWLPKDCPGMRVLAVNYTTDPFLWRPVWIAKRIRSNISQRSQEMEDNLLRLGVGTHPIIWVGHSKGGLYVKQMLVDGRHSGDPLLASFLVQTKGIMFYSVPHRGSYLANWNLPLLRQSVELTEVKKDCDYVLDLHRKFLKLFEDKSLMAEVFSFVETELTFMFVTNIRVVTVDSADLGMGLFRGVNIDHREICKPLNRNCFLYQELIRLIHRVV